MQALLSARFYPGHLLQYTCGRLGFTPGVIIIFLHNKF